MYTDGKGERVVYKSYLVEGPTWSPNGRVLSFYSQSKFSKGKISSPKIKLVDLTGMNLRELITPTDASDPSWSGFVAMIFYLKKLNIIKKSFMIDLCRIRM